MIRGCQSWFRSSWPIPILAAFLQLPIACGGKRTVGAETQVESNDASRQVRDALSGEGSFEATDASGQDVPADTADAKEECVSGCQGKVCGYDGCGGVCGWCDVLHLCVEGECQIDVPAALPLAWTNLGNLDLVTIGKKVVLEFEAGTPMPGNADDELLYHQVFESNVTLWDEDEGASGEEVPVVKVWRRSKPGMFPRPALILQPVQCEVNMVQCSDGIANGQWLPDTTYRVTVWLGDQEYERVFHTYPEEAEGLMYKIVELTVPSQTDCWSQCDGDCDKCFPYPVTVRIFIPPGYATDVSEFDNSLSSWENVEQRYPLVVGLHGSDAGLAVADAFGYSVLPHFTAQGKLEPLVLVTVNGTVSQPYCGEGWQWPGVDLGKTCHTFFIGIPDSSGAIGEAPWFSYSFFLAHTLREFLSTRIRLRGWTNEGEMVNSHESRRATGVAGLVMSGTRAALLNGFRHPESFGAIYSSHVQLPSIFCPWAFSGWDGGPPIEQICNSMFNDDYPLEPVGGGFRDLSMVAPETMTPCLSGSACDLLAGQCVPEASCLGQCSAEAPCAQTGLVRDITIDDREIKGGSATCATEGSPFLLPLVTNDEVLGVGCSFDPTCLVDPEAPTQFQVDFEEYPFYGNIFFSTGTKDASGPPAGLLDLDQQLDKRGVPHSFWYLDSGGIFHGWGAVLDEVLGSEEVMWMDGSISPGNFPGTGALYPFFNRAFEGLGNRSFNHPFASEFTARALDPDSDRYIDLLYEARPELGYVEDNCPGVYNPDQLDSDNDGVGDACDR